MSILGQFSIDIRKICGPSGGHFGSSIKGSRRILNTNFLVEERYRRGHDAVFERWILEYGCPKLVGPYGFGPRHLPVTDVASPTHREFSKVLLWRGGSALIQEPKQIHGRTLLRFIQSPFATRLFLAV